MDRDANQPLEEWISPVDHDAGFKDIIVTLRTGETRDVRVNALPHREWRRIHQAWKTRVENDPETVNAEDLLDAVAKAAAHGVELDRLTRDSVEIVRTAALIMANGYPEQKKMEAGFSRLTQKLSSSPPSMPSVPSCEPVSATNA